MTTRRRLPPGETVTFQLSNSGKVAHGFVIGDEAVQDEHEQEVEE